MRGSSGVARSPRQRVIPNRLGPPTSTFRPVCNTRRGVGQCVPTLVSRPVPGSPDTGESEQRPMEFTPCVRDSDNRKLMMLAREFLYDFVE